MGGRVSLTPRPAGSAEPVLAACFIGHCPGAVRPQRLRQPARAALRGIGLGRAVDYLDAAHPLPGAPPVDLPAELDDATRDRLAALQHLPLPLRSAAELDDLFPNARTAPTSYASKLGGAGAWLPRAVDDWFANGGELLWLIVVPEAEGRGGFFGLGSDALAAEAGAGTSADLGATGATGGRLALHEPLGLRGLALALAIPDIGLLALPDLERLQVPAQLAGPARVRLPNPAPSFLPCSAQYNDGHRERRDAPEMLTPAPPVSTLTILDAIAGALAGYRPDLQCLFALPLAAGGVNREPQPDPVLLADLGARAARGWSAARRLQLLWPYLRDDRQGLRSPSGAVGGAQAAVSARLGPWRSAAGVSLSSTGTPYPPTPRELVVALREHPGVGVLYRSAGVLRLDDERLLVPALPAADAIGAHAAGWRSGEVQRFLGWLMRRLRRLGEALVFDADPDDPRVALLLERFFRALHDRGALRGARPEDAFTIRPLRPAGRAGDGVLGFEIELAPAFPLDRLRLTFVNRAGEWVTGGPQAGTARAAA
ncbi:hypothetical protein [Thiohalocapsa sp.]|uniref:hypothetical protein n=1 Tax=Thiohalocapsa sp. TaxID=2497641 RepID=UPI0025CF4D56|nr:hypothetical protein [Thiohalocapsa sp.]